MKRAAMIKKVKVERGSSRFWVIQCVEVPGAISEARSLGLHPPISRLLRAPIRARRRRSRTSTGLRPAFGTRPCRRTRLVTLATPSIGGSRLSSAPELMREAIAWVAGVDASDIEIVLEPALPERVASQTAAARLAVAELAETQRRTAELSRAAVRDMVDAGLSGRDVSVVLGISPQRVSQLLAGSSS